MVKHCAGLSKLQQAAKYELSEPELYSSSGSSVSHQGKTRLTQYAFRLPDISSCYVTSSLHPSIHPAFIPEFCWDHECTGSGDTERKKQKWSHVLILFPITHTPLAQLFPLTHPAVASFYLHSSQLCPTFRLWQPSPLLLHHVPLYSHTHLSTVLGNEHV